MMSKKEKNSKTDNVPELRFPEFEYEGGWEYKELWELGELINGLTYSPDDVREEGLLVLRSSNIRNGLIDLNDRVYVRSNIKGANLSKKNDILICVRNGSKELIGKNAIVPQNMPLATHGAFMTVLRSNKSEFIFQLFQTDFYTSQVKADLGATINSINGKNLLKYKFPVPKNIKEQQKIASCLSSLDEVIVAHSQKLELLKEHKKGLMQNLFPQEGEKVPKLRFKEFEKDGEWKEKKLGDKDVAVLVNEKQTINELTLETYISTENMLPEFTGVSVASHFPSSESFTKFRTDDILISNIRPYLKKIWKADKIGGASNDVIVFRSGPAVFSDFLAFVLKNDSFINYVMQSAKGVKMPRGDKDSILNFTVFIPSKEEQQKIASCLSALDVLVKAEMEMIELLKQHKKGLMQGLFPAMNG